MSFDKTIHKTIEINASVSKVWDALINPEVIKLWMWEGVNVTSDWKVGSPITSRENSIRLTIRIKDLF